MVELSLLRLVCADSSMTEEESTSVGALVRTKRSHADRKDVKRFGPSVPEGEGRVEGLKSSSAPGKKGGRGRQATV
ncbi:hypothetical protein JOQ06_025968 [Pogonophryne albipinna]|uniref:Uncharacterized protein n=1 Tax=Pogonophryne albipinna TaxID=1090488 RepID=A0AAD6F4V9_9TELE|nr:hypothetical protein JOQ06_025968 [Pogonophryne albipinna]